MSIQQYLTYNIIPDDMMGWKHIRFVLEQEDMQIIMTPSWGNNSLKVRLDP